MRIILYILLFFIGMGIILYGFYQNISINTFDYSNDKIVSSNISVNGSFDGFCKYNLWVYQLQNFNPRSDFEGLNVSYVVIDYSYDGSDEQAYTRKDLEHVKAQGAKVLAYLSIGEAESYRYYWRDEWFSNAPDWLGKENINWDENYAVKYWSPEWQSIIYDYLDKIIAQGFDGVYLDKIDAYEYWSYEEPIMSEEESATLMAAFVKNLSIYAKSKNSSFLVVPQNGELIAHYDPDVLNYVDGWGVEGLFYDPALSKDELAERQNLIKQIHANGKFILSVDYVDDGSFSKENLERVKDYVISASAQEYYVFPAHKNLSLDWVNIKLLKYVVNNILCNSSMRGSPSLVNGGGLKTES